MNADYDLEERLLEYSARIIRLVERLPNRTSRIRPQRNKSF
jgi:hypothetical protein